MKKAIRRQIVVWALVHEDGSILAVHISRAGARRDAFYRPFGQVRRAVMRLGDRT
jgi:hypothetical protein